MIADRYPTADILAQRGHWDAATREVVLDRIHNVPKFTFFNDHQRATLEALCRCVIPQEHRPPDRQVSIAPWIDQRCAEHVLDGFRLEDLPDTEDAWTWGLEGLDQTAQDLFRADFAELHADQQDAVLEAVRGGNPMGDVWQRLPAARWWCFIALRQISGVYYAHPYAWDEIGFGGPAYPRGYFALNHGAPEPWEPREVQP